MRVRKQQTSIAVILMMILSKKILTSKSFVVPKHLPPTEHSLQYHSYRAYYQILKWLNTPSIKAEHWGWKVVHNPFEPITTDQNAAPDTLLSIIRCKCKSDCSTLRCSCKNKLIEMQQLLWNLRIKGVQ